MTSQEASDAQQAAPPALPSPPGQQPQLQGEGVGEKALALSLPQDDALALVPSHALVRGDSNADADADASCRATRSSFPSQNGEAGLDAAKVLDSPASSEKHTKGAWTNEWVISLIHLRGCMDDEFMKPQKSGMDLWTRVCTGMTQAHEDFNKNGESCRKKWQRVYKMFKDQKAAVAAAGAMEDRQMPCKWYDLIERYMHRHFDANGNSIGGGGDEFLHHPDTVSRPDAAENSDDAIAHHIRVNAKRARRDQEIKETLSKMVVTWRESLQALKESEARRLEILQKMSSSMTGLLDTLKK